MGMLGQFKYARRCTRALENKQKFQQVNFREHEHLPRIANLNCDMLDGTVHHATQFSTDI